MELSIFMKELESALIKRGVSQETAKRHVSNLKRTFTSDDLSEIEAINSENEIEQLADSISLILSRNTKSVLEASPEQVRQKPKPPTPTAQTPMQKTAQQNEANLQPYKAAKPHIQSDETPAPARAKPSLKKDYDDDYFEYTPGGGDSTRGKAIFWIGLILTLPITLALAAVIFGSFAALFVSLSALIIALIAVLIIVAALGSAISLVGIIFGITQLFSFLAAGIYEIGTGVMVAGITLFASIIIYNLAVRLIPWLISHLGTLLGIVCEKLKILFLFVRRECYKL